jgi:hypothetical protein
MPSLRRYFQAPIEGRLPIDNAAYCLNRAEEILTIAEGMTNRQARLELLGVAEGYKRLAEHAYQRAKRSDSA